MHACVHQALVLRMGSVRGHQVKASTAEGFMHQTLAHCNVHILQAGKKADPA